MLRQEGLCPAYALAGERHDEVLARNRIGRVVVRGEDQHPESRWRSSRDRKARRYADRLRRESLTRIVGRLRGVDVGGIGAS